MENRKVEALTVFGDHFSLEMPRIDGRSPIDNRPVVYLDQNHWSTLGKTLYRPDTINSSKELDAARKLIRFGLYEAIVLPMSFAHVSETCQWADFEHRYQHAYTMLSLSHGWQLRDPLQIRNQELREILIKKFLRSVHAVPLEMITLQADALTAGREQGTGRWASDLPFEMQVDQRALQSAIATADALLGRDTEIRPESLDWAKKNSDLSEWLSGQSLPAQAKVKKTGGFFLADTSSEIATAASSLRLTAEVVGEWISSADCLSAITGAPALGLYREAIHAKIVNSKSHWESNDLTDLFYMTSAGGYVDHLVCEREAASVIRQSLQRLGRKTPQIHSKLSTLVERLKIDLPDI